MTTLERTLGLDSYRESLSHAAKLAPKQAERLAEALRYEVSAPDDVKASDWSSAVGALRYAYEVAVREGFEAVQNDISAALATEMDSSALQALLRLLAEDDAVAQRIAGTRERDAVLPNLVNARFALDLRAIALDGDDDLQLAPTITVRLEFDEHVAGQDAITFQVPLWALDELAADLSRISARVRKIDADLPTATVPVWARAADPEKAAK